MNTRLVSHLINVVVAFLVVLSMHPAKGAEGLQGSTNSPLLNIPFTLQTDESNAALLGRQCAVIWFASESKTFKPEAVEKDLLAAVTTAKALGVTYTEEQFRNAFKKTEQKSAEDFAALFPESLEKAKGEKARDIYLFSFWCTAARNWVSLIPLFESPKEQETPRTFVANPLAKAMKVARGYDDKTAKQCEELGIRSLSDPLSTFDQTDKFAGEILTVQKRFLLKFLTAEQVEMVLQPFLKRKR